MELKKEYLEELKEKFNSDRANKIAQYAATTNGIEKAALNNEKTDGKVFSFNIEVKQGKITDQKRSGRCWMFASLNVMRNKIIKKYNLKTFELSQSYPLFFDKLERANYFLNSILKTLDEELTGRLVSHLLTDLMGDGGQWDMFKNIVNKYGVVPKYAFEESENSSNTTALNNFLKKLLRRNAFLLRDAHENGKSKEELEKMIEDFMKEIYNVLSISLGTPPTKINFEAVDKDDNHISYKNLTPQEFFKNFVEMDTNDYISIINAPTKDKPFNETYTVKFLGNVIEGDPVKYINLDIKEFKKAALKQLQGGEPVWFGCDVGQFFYRAGYNLDLNTLKADELFNVDFKLNKSQRLDYHESLMTHAMVFTGVEYDEKNDKTLRWKVENSWGKDSGHDGYLVMSDEWFDEYMYQILINKKYLTQETIENFKKAPKELEPWDPMGSLAK